MLGPFWNGYRKCPICRAEIGEPCVALSARIVEGRPDQVPVPLLLAHKMRQHRTSRDWFA